MIAASTATAATRGPKRQSPDGHTPSAARGEIWPTVNQSPVLGKPPLPGSTPTEVKNSAVLDSAGTKSTSSSRPAGKAALAACRTSGATRRPARGGTPISNTATQASTASGHAMPKKLYVYTHAA